MSNGPPLLMGASFILLVVMAQSPSFSSIKTAGSALVSLLISVLSLLWQLDQFLLMNLEKKDPDILWSQLLPRITLLKYGNILLRSHKNNSISMLGFISNWQCSKPTNKRFAASSGRRDGLNLVLYNTSFSLAQMYSMVDLGWLCEIDFFCQQWGERINSDLRVRVPSVSDSPIDDRKLAGSVSGRRRRRKLSLWREWSLERVDFSGIAQMMWLVFLC